MTEIQLTNVQFAQIQIDNLIAKDKPYIETWSAGDVGSFNAILNAVDYDNEFTYNMRGWSRQRVKSGTGAMIEVNEMNADQLWETTMDPSKRSLIQLNLGDALIAQRIVSVLMGDKADLRRDWIEKHVSFTLEDNFAKESNHG